MKKILMIVGGVITLILTHFASSSKKVDGETIVSFQKDAKDIKQLETLNCGGF